MIFYRQIVQVREELKAEIRYQREVSGRVQKHPDVTTKHGKLKSKRKNPPTTIYVDDLAALDSLSEVSIYNLSYKVSHLEFTHCNTPVIQ